MEVPFCLLPLLVYELVTIHTAKPHLEHFLYTSPLCPCFYVCPYGIILTRTNMVDSLNKLCLNKT